MLTIDGAGLLHELDRGGAAAPQPLDVGGTVTHSTGWRRSVQRTTRAKISSKGGQIGGAWRACVEVGRTAATSSGTGEGCRRSQTVAGHTGCGRRHES